VQSVGIDRVIERAGVAKASLYSTFGSKEELGRAYLDERHARIVGRLRAAVAAADPDDPVAQILAVFDAQAKLFRAPDYHGCAFTAAAAEAPRDGRIVEAARAYRREIRALFAELATAAGAADPHCWAASCSSCTTAPAPPRTSRRTRQSRARPAQRPRHSLQLLAD
jgi:AcrR family transcriptional regulator